MLDPETLSQLAPAVAIVLISAVMAVAMVQLFVKHLEKRDIMLAEEIDKNRKAHERAQEMHAAHFSAEQNRFIDEMEAQRKHSQNMFDRLMDRCKIT